MITAVAVAIIAVLAIAAAFYGARVETANRAALEKLTDAELIQLERDSWTADYRMRRLILDEKVRRLGASS